MKLIKNKKKKKTNKKKKKIKKKVIERKGTKIYTRTNTGM